jgi:hypothetical protein
MAEFCVRYKAWRSNKDKETPSSVPRWRRQSVSRVKLTSQLSSKGDDTACGSLEYDVRGKLVVGLVAPLPALVAFLSYGAIETPDSAGYISYAEQLRAWILPSGTALLKEAPAPVSLYRTPGYPAAIAVMQSLFGAAWKAALVLLQIIAHAALAVTVYRTAVLLRLSKSLAIFVALLPSIGLGLVMQISLLTDAIYAALLGCAALWLVLATVRPTRMAPVTVGVALAGAMLLREATMFIAVGFAPAVWIASRPGSRLRWFCSAFLPLIARGCVDGRDQLRTERVSGCHH